MNIELRPSASDLPLDRGCEESVLARLGPLRIIERDAPRWKVGIYQLMGKMLQTPIVPNGVTVGSGDTRALRASNGMLIATRNEELRSRPSFNADRAL